ncbi:MAG: PHB depolymerase family esterase [Myxococcaceae bacterium]
MRFDHRVRQWVFATAASALLCIAGCGVNSSSGSNPQCSETASSKSALEVTAFGSNPGNLRMHTYVPADMPADAPLVVALHGCTQTAAAYANAGWNDLADEWKFYVVYPETTALGSCFKWFEASHTRRDSGEAHSVKQMVDWMMAKHDIDPERVFVTGLSAGGAMASVLLAAYPDVFSAGAIMAGIPYGCADTQANIGVCMTGRDQTPGAWGELVRAARPNGAAFPRVSIWHGSGDYVVGYPNMRELVDQWTDVHGLSTTATSTEEIGKATHSSFKNAAGQTLVESWSIAGMGHGTAVDPGFAAAGGCGTAGAFVLDVNLCSTYHAGLFFGLDGKGNGGTGNEPDPDGNPCP